jgi:hypothetical protein
VSLENRNTNLLINDMNLTKRRLAETVEALEVLVNMYVKNKGTANEFISCITPESSCRMTGVQRRRDTCWRAWDKARKVIEKVKP